jgi:hypothetical protein
MCGSSSLFFISLFPPTSGLWFSTHKHTQTHTNTHKHTHTHTRESLCLPASVFIHPPLSSRQGRRRGFILGTLYAIIGETAIHLRP